MRVKPSVIYKDLGKIDFEEAWNTQGALLKDLIATKRLEENKGKQYYQENTLLVCEHNPVYTLGKSGKMEHLLKSEEELEKESLQFFKINRGGDITYHGPGQITGYPIFDLDEFFNDVHRYVRSLEEVIIKVLAHYHIIGTRQEGYTGVWVQDPLLSNRKIKICAIGVHLSRWVTMHGFAFNVNTNLDHFKNIIPCGIQDESKGVTSMQQILNRKIDMEEVKLYVKQGFQQVFDFNYR